MAKSLLLAWSSPTSPEQEADFHAWYDGTHIPQLRENIPTITAATKYKLVDPKPDAPDSFRFLVVYEIDGSVQEAALQLRDASIAGRLDMTDSMDTGERAPVLQWVTQA